MGIAGAGEGDLIGLDMHQIAGAQLAQCAFHLGGRPAEMVVQSRGGQFIALGSGPLVTMNMAEDEPGR